MSSSNKPTLPIMEKLNGWKKYLQWIEIHAFTQSTLPFVGHVYIVECRSRLCAINANQCVWKHLRVYDDKTHKSIFKNHDADITHAKFVKLQVDGSRNDTLGQKQAKEKAAKCAEEREDVLKKKRDQFRSILWSAKEEFSICKYRSLLRYSAELDGSTVEVS